jgi:hypothetical protein
MLKFSLPSLSLFRFTFEEQFARFPAYIRVSSSTEYTEQSFEFSFSLIAVLQSAVGDRFSLTFLTPTTSFGDGFIPTTKDRDRVLSTLNVLIQALDIAKDACGIPPAQIALGSAGVLLTMIRVCSPILCEEKRLIRAFLRHDV